MEQDIKVKIIELDNLLNNIGWDLSEARTKLENLEINLKEKDENIIKDINNLKRELKRDGLYSNAIEEFLENYMKYYNK